MKEASVFGGVGLAGASRKRVRVGIKLALAVAALAWLAGGHGWGKIAQGLAHVIPSWFLLAVGVYLVGQSLCAWKWSLLAETLGFRKPLRFYWVNYLGAMFPSLFLPTSVGGDVFRVVALAHGGGDKVNATVSVLADRGTGMLALVWIAAAATALDRSFQHQLAWSEAIYGLSAAMTVAFALPFFVRPGFTRKGFLGRAMACWDHPRLLLSSLGISLLFQILVGVIYVLLGRALALPVNATFYFFLCPLVSVAAMSPVTINGLGERVAALVFLFALVGVGRETAVVFGLVWTALVTVAALFGGVVLFCADRQAGWNDGDAAH